MLASCNWILLAHGVQMSWRKGLNFSRSSHSCHFAQREEFLFQNSPSKNSSDNLKSCPGKLQGYKVEIVHTVGNLAWHWTAVATASLPPFSIALQSKAVKTPTLGQSPIVPTRREVSEWAWKFWVSCTSEQCYSSQQCTPAVPLWRTALDHLLHTPCAQYKQ